MSKKSTDKDLGPSMDEILTSIRNVINNDDNDEDVLELTEIASDTDKSLKQTEKKEIDKIIKDKVEEIKEDVIIVPESKVEPQEESLISKNAANVAADALKSLKETITVPTEAPSEVKFRSGTTLEDLVIETMKPYLSKWLDENLPDIVKKLVEKEIQKLTPKKEE